MFVFFFQIPIVDSELRKAAGEEGEGEVEGERDKPSTPSQLVTAYGTYATQSAFTAAPVSKEEKVLANSLIHSYMHIADSLILTDVTIYAGLRYVAIFWRASSL